MSLSKLNSFAKFFAEIFQKDFMFVTSVSSLFPYTPYQKDLLKAAETMEILAFAQETRRKGQLSRELRDNDKVFAQAAQITSIYNKFNQVYQKAIRKALEIVDPIPAVKARVYEILKVNECLTIDINKIGANEKDERIIPLSVGEPEMRESVLTELKALNLYNEQAKMATSSMENNI